MVAILEMIGPSQAFLLLPVQPTQSFESFDFNAELGLAMALSLDHVGSGYVSSISSFSDQAESTKAVCWKAGSEIVAAS